MFKHEVNTDVLGDPLTMDQTADPPSALVHEIISITSEYGWKDDPTKLKRVLELEKMIKNKSDINIDNCDFVKMK
tara:strand:+ start:359 stop:583 length:225 start_codon:yes stop_codon:yes gene_type:complete